MTRVFVRSIRALSVFYLIFLSALILSHWPVLSLPYFWDELGQFVPAALDIFWQGAWVPHSTLPNVHPPGVMAYLALVWKLAGYSILVTRTAMLLLAAVGVLSAFLLAIELCRGLNGAPALLVPILLLSSPLFWAQSMMAQLDMPAMVFTLLALLFFLKEQMAACVAACFVLVLCKESSIPVPFVFGCVLLYERRWRQALLFFLPAAALAGWLLFLYKSTGHLLGNQEFTHYNVGFQLHPVRLTVTFVRRAFYLLIDNFHWVGTAAIVLALRRGDVFRNRAWGITAAVALLQTLIVTVLGGAALERYLVPVLPLFYIAVAAALSTVRAGRRTGAALVMTAGLLAAILINSPFAYPFENNAAFVPFVQLQRHAAEYVEHKLPGRTVVSAWPFSDALRRTEFGYVTRPVRAQGIPNFAFETVRAFKGRIDVLVTYSRTWEPTWGVLRYNWVRDFLTEYYFYQPQITREEIETELGLTPVARWEDRGQWIEIYISRNGPDDLVL